MARQRRQLPLAPIVLTVLLLAAGGLCLIFRSDDGRRLDPPAEGTVRVVSWDVRDPQGAIPAWAIAATLKDLNADLIALQGLTAEEQAVQVGRRLDGDWKVEALPGIDGRYLAVFVGPRLTVVSYHLVPTSAGDALALTLCRRQRPPFRLVCFEANRAVSDRQARERHLAGVLAWCSAHPAPLIVLAGRIDVGAELQTQLASQFANVCTSPGVTSELRAAPPNAEFARAGFRAQGFVSEVGGRPALADVHLP